MTATATRLDPEGTVRLLSRMLAGLPALPNAACTGRARVFTSDDPKDQQIAASICAECPELPRCRAWLQRLPPSQRPAGVIAGQLPPPHRPVPDNHQTPERKPRSHDPR